MKDDQGFHERMRRNFADYVCITYSAGLYVRFNAFPHVIKGLRGVPGETEEHRFGKGRRIVIEK